MFSKNETSTFVELLKSINNKVLNSKRQNLGLGEFKSLSIGVDEVSTGYPYLMVLPIREQIKRVYTTSYADVVRTVMFRVRTIKPKQDAAFGQALGLINNIKETFARKSANHLWKLKNLKGSKIVFNTKIGDIQHVDHQDHPKGVIAEAALSIDFFCQIRTDAIRPVSASQLSSTNLKELTKIIAEIIGRYKDAGLPTIKTLKYGAIEPISKFPAVVIRPDVADIETRFSGSDSYESSFIISVFTDFLNAPNSIYTNLSIIHKIRDILFANKFMFNRVYDYDANEFVTGTSILNDIGYFTTELYLRCSSFEPNLGKILKGEVI